MMICMTSTSGWRLDDSLPREEGYRTADTFAATFKIFETAILKYHKTFIYDAMYLNVAQITVQVHTICAKEVVQCDTEDIYR